MKVACDRYVLFFWFCKSFCILTFIFFLLGTTFSKVDAKDRLRLLVLGDSLTAGYGLLPQYTFPARLEARLKTKGFKVKVLNGGVSGDTSAGGKARLNWALKEKPHYVVLELGANDGLRGLNPNAMRSNLNAIIIRLIKANIPVLLTGMKAPPNLGSEYIQKFNRVFPELAEKHGILFYPFFLLGVATKQELNLRDGIHPNKRGVEVIVDGIMPFVVRLLSKKTLNTKF